jgi:iron complex outermembrane receptor protein
LAATPPADNNTVALESVVVTAIRDAYRGDTPLNELPQSVTVLSADQLQDVGATQLDTALDLASGVAHQNNFGGLRDSFAIRGFAGDDNAPSGYLVNGFNAGRGSGRRDTVNIERIEVLKGPGSALYGRGEPGGTINLVTKKPLFHQEGSIEVSGGSFNVYRAAADYTGPINDAVAVRLNGAYQHGDSFRDKITSKKHSLTPSLLVRLNSSTALGYELEWVKQETPFDRGVVAVNGVLGLIPASRFLGEPNDGPMSVYALGHQLSLQHSFNSNWSLLVGGSYRDSSMKGYSTEAELVGSRQQLFTNPAAGVLTRQHRFRDEAQTDVSGRAELSGKFHTGPVVHHMLLGADVYDFKSVQILNLYRPRAGSLVYTLNIYDPVYGSASPPLSPLRNNLERDRAHGMYVQDQMDLTEHWKALGGVRFDGFSEAIDSRLQGTTAHQSQTATSPRLGLVYEVNPQVTFYASYSKGFRPNTGSDFYGVPFAPEISRSYEIGSKLQSPDKRLTGTIAVFDGKKSNFLTTDPVNAGFSIAGGEATSKGVELDASGYLLEDLRATVSYSYIDAVVSKAIIDVSFGYTVPAGSPLINIPKNSGYALLIRDFHINAARLSVGVGANYVSKRLGETGYLPRFDLPSYTLINLVGEYVPTAHLSLSLHVDNLFDRVYYPSSYSRLWVAAGAPRAYTFSGAYKF